MSFVLHCSMLLSSVVLQVLRPTGVSQTASQELAYLDGVTSFIQTQIDSKNPTLSTSGQGVFLHSNVLSGYDLRWDISNVPSQVLDCLRFDGFTIAGKFNLGPSQLEL